MIKRVSLVVAMVLLSYSAGFASEYLNQDAGWWQTKPHAVKLAILEGMLSAYQTGWAGGVSAEMIRFVYEATPSSKAAIHAIAFRKLADGHYAALAHNSPQFNRTFGEYVTAIDSFYDRSDKDMDIGEVLQCIQDDASQRPPSCPK